MSINWKQILVKLSGIHADLTKQQQKRVPFKNEKGKDTPLQAEFTGDKFPKSGDPAKKDVSAWKEQNSQFKKLDSKGNPDGGKSVNDASSWRNLGSALTNAKAGRAETVESHEELAQGSAPTYKTGTKYRVGSKFSSRVSKNLAVLKDMGTFSKFKEKIASKEYAYVSPTGESAPANENLIVVAYTRPERNDGAVLLTPLGNFVASFEYKADYTVPPEKAEDKDEKQDQPFDKNPDEGSQETSSDASEMVDIKNDVEEVPEGGAAYVLGDDGKPRWFTVEDMVEMINSMKDEEKAEGEVHTDGQDSDAGLHGESRFITENDLRSWAKSPPHSEYTVHEMKKHRNKIDNPFALAWWMKNKGMHLHDKKPKESSWQSVLLAVANNSIISTIQAMLKANPQYSYIEKFLNVHPNNLKVVADDVEKLMRGGRTAELWGNTPSGEQAVKHFGETIRPMALNQAVYAMFDYIRDVVPHVNDAMEGAITPSSLNQVSPSVTPSAWASKIAAKKPYYCSTCDSGFSESQMNFHKSHEYEKRGEGKDTVEDEGSEESKLRKEDEVHMESKEASVDHAELCQCGDPRWKHKHDGVCQNGACSCPEFRSKSKEVKEAANIEFQKKPDGTVNISMEDTPAGMGDMVNGMPTGGVPQPQPTAPPAGTDQTQAPAPAPAKGKKAAYRVGSTVNDADLGKGTIESINGQEVIASFSGKKYKTTLSALG